MKAIGLVGGTTPESTKVYYELLIRGARRPGASPLRNPVILIHSLNLEVDVREALDVAAAATAASFNRVVGAGNSRWTHPSRSLHGPKHRAGTEPRHHHHRCPPSA
jgi:hypothetical protein